MPLLALVGSRAGGWLVGGGVALVIALALWTYVRHLQNEMTRLGGMNATVASQLDQATTTANANAAAARELQAEATRTVAAITKDRDAAMRRSTLLQATLARISNASPSEDGPVAPVLRRFLDELRGGAATAADAASDRTR